jgi:uncharacterized protein (TIGR01244 family)
MRGAALALLFLTPSLGAQTAPAGVANYTRVDATMACAGATAVEAIPALKKEGFKAIVNLRLASEQGANVDASRAAAEAAGLKYFHIPFSGAEPSTRAVDDFLVALKDPANSPVFVHCGSASRAGMMWLVKRVMLDGWSVEKASEEAERAGLKNPKLKAFALEYLKAHGKA